jgi:hypothetical protein
MELLVLVLLGATAALLGRRREQAPAPVPVRIDDD